MNEGYLVRCVAAPGRAMAGIYAAGLTNTGVVATWKPGKARRFPTELDAARVARRLAGKYSGTAWEVCHA